MLRRTIIAALLALAAACTPANETSGGDAHAAPDPATVVSALYEPYMTEGATFPDFEHQAPWSASLWAALQAMTERSQQIGEPILDFDPLIDAQDYQLSNIAVTTDGVVENSHATVRAQFTNAGTPTEVIYDMVWEDGGWRVDNIRTSQWDLRQIAAGPEPAATP